MHDVGFEVYMLLIFSLGMMFVFGVIYPIFSIIIEKWVWQSKKSVWQIFKSIW